MRYFQLLLFIFTICSTVAELFEQNRSKQIEFLDLQREYTSECWTDHRILSKKVIFNDDFISVNDYFKVEDGLMMSWWPIYTENVIDITYLMKTIASCEFSELFYHIIESAKNKLIFCQKNANDNMMNIQVACVKPVFDELLNISENEILKIISMLTDYSKFRNNFVSNKQDILSILLTWYLHRDLFNTKMIDDTKIMNSIETFKSIWGQIQFALKGFIIRNCQRDQAFLLNSSIDDGNIKIRLSKCIPKEKKNVKNTSKENLGKELEEELKEGQKKGKLLENGEQQQLQEKLPKEMLKKILNVDSHLELLDIIKRNMILKIQWNHSQWLSINDIFVNYIVDSKQLNTVLRYEQMIVFLLAKLVHSFVVSEIQLILESSYDENACKTLLDVFDEFEEEARKQKLPVVFISDIKVIQSKIVTIFRYFGRIHALKQAKKMFEKMKLDDIIRLQKPWVLISYDRQSSTKSETNVTTLKSFLSNFILVHIKNTYLNSDIIDVLNDASYITMFGPFGYVFNYEIVHLPKEITPDDGNRMKLCDNIEKAQGEATVNIGLIGKCSDAVKAYINAQDPKDTELKTEIIDTFSEYNESVVNLKKYVIASVLDAYPDQRKSADVDFSLGKLLLTYLYNLKNVDLFDAYTQQYMNDVRVENLKTFHLDFQNILFRCHLLMCSEKPSTSTRNYSTAPASKNIIHAPEVYRILSMSNAEYSDDSPEQWFGVIKKYTTFISDVYNEFHGEQIRFYWNGMDKSMYAIKTEMNKTTFDLQDLIEFQYSTFKWIISAVFSVYLNILTGITFSNFKSSDVPLACFNEQYTYLSSLSFHSFTSRPITYIIEQFHDIITTDGTKREAKYLRLLILQELNMLEIEVLSLPNVTDDDIEAYAKRVCSKTDALKGAKFSELFETVGIRQVLMDRPELPPISEIDFYIENRHD